MKTIALINPNTSQATTTMMVDIIRRYLPPEFSVAGLTATTGVPMILDENALAASANGVIEMGTKAVAEQKACGIVIGAFGDPGIDILRASVAVPVVGLCEASLVEASRDGRRFGIATVTPDLVSSFAAKAESLGLSPLFTGTRLTPGDPLRLAADPARLHEALAIATRESIDDDGAEAVIIGGGPLGQVAESLRDHFTVPIIAPLASAASILMREIATRPVVGLETAG